MSLPKPMGFGAWLVWNYQGRPDVTYEGPLVHLWAVGPRFQFPGEKRWVVSWSKRINELSGRLRNDEMYGRDWTLRM
jgi:hypothetical protein